jgi:mannose-6-phosphate isomerase-like protein (cupin superfamily)
VPHVAGGASGDRREQFDEAEFGAPTRGVDVEQRPDPLRGILAHLRAEVCGAVEAGLQVEDADRNQVIEQRKTEGAVPVADASCSAVAPALPASSTRPSVAATRMDMGVARSAMARIERSTTRTYSPASPRHHRIRSAEAARSRSYKTAPLPRARIGAMTTTDPVNLTTALASFDEVYSPRIVARMNDYDVRIAHTKGEHVWHVHEDTDEFFLVLDGRFDVAIREADGTERTVVLHKGDTFVVPKGTEHKPSSPGGSILMFEPSGTSTTGDRHEGEIPAHVDSTTGHALS